MTKKIEIRLNFALPKSSQTNKYESEIIKTLMDAVVVRKNTKSPAVLKVA